MQDESSQIALIGYSGHAYVVAEAALLSGIQISGYVDKSVATSNPFDLKYLGNEHSEEFEGWIEGAKFILGIGDNRVRIKAANFIRAKGYDILTIVHPNSFVSSYCKINSGVFIARNVAINPFCAIAKDVIINTSASIDHECIIGTGSHIAPGAILAGNVIIGKNSLIGANAVVKQGVTIGDNVIIGAGAVVLKDVESDKKLVGNPAKLIDG